MDPSELGSDVEVELDVFSGRPNPRWTLSGERAAEVGERLRDEGSAEPESSDPPGLGYRGFVVSGGSVKLRVFDSLVTMELGGRRRSWRDAGGAEELLLAQARDHGYGDILRVFRDETRPSRAG